MASTKEQMLKARELIKAKRYKEARAILKKINHPTAKEWLERIDSMGAASSGKAKAGSAKGGKKAASDEDAGGTSAVGLLLRFMVLIAIIGVIAAVFIFINGSGNDPESGTTTDTSTSGNDSSVPPFVQGNQPGNATPFSNIGGPPVGGPIQFNDPAAGPMTVILPPRWSQAVPGVGVLSHMDYGEAIVVVTGSPVSVTEGGQTLQDIATTLASAGGGDVAFNEYEHSGRTILQTRIDIGEGQQSDVYFVEADGGRVAVLTVQPEAQRSDTLRDDLLQMAGSVKFG